jgi:hypothetical protein
VQTAGVVLLDDEDRVLTLPALAPTRLGGSVEVTLAPVLLQGLARRRRAHAATSNRRMSVGSASTVASIAST